ncbi:haloacid dehalogenase-like hydrolase [Bowmanella sp. Y26]|uniref:HAD family hydrolase n=1 Tax=Bowmanella yangjiangensis TaxID=2811230 RepID=UPI001BDD92A3|nr:HAD family hydrolase [Bowmanella yangjiangensis]MBT1064670.1 haloacid dehalogenase-like hydrolase [Bowmanella yangjiangensis]
MTSKNLLPSWQPGLARDAILEFIERVTHPESLDFVPQEQRIATFDNDGTLWPEKPNITELVFLKDLMRFDEPRSLPIGAGLRQKIKHWLHHIHDELIEDTSLLIKEFRDGISTDEYHGWVSAWLEKAVHPRFKRPYTELTYKPMREVLDLFQQAGFKNYLVSGGSCYFIRPWSQQTYGIPPEQVIGSRLVTRLVDKPDGLAVEMAPVPWFLDNGAGKVLAIESQIAKRPVAAFGNSSGDIQMLRWAGTSPTSLCVLIEHTDDIREYRYSPGDDTLAAAIAHGWTRVDMLRDWQQVFN